MKISYCLCSGVIIINQTGQGVAYLLENHEPFLEVPQVLLSREQLRGCDLNRPRAIIIDTTAAAAVFFVGVQGRRFDRPAGA